MVMRNLSLFSKKKKNKRFIVELQKYRNMYAVPATTVMAKKNDVVATVNHCFSLKKYFYTEIPRI